jgi:c-di-GMP-binding flagellar brake protein YcgR
VTTHESHHQSKRRFERAKQLLLVNYRVVQFHQDVGEFDDGMTASTVDFSAGGMMLRMTESFPPKTLLDLRFRLTVDSPEINVLSSVVRAVPAEYEGVYYVSVEYPMLSDGDRAAIDKHVKEINHRRA